MFKKLSDVWFVITLLGLCSLSAAAQSNESKKFMLINLAVVTFFGFLYIKSTEK